MAENEEIPEQFCPKCAGVLARRWIDDRDRWACGCGFVLFDNPTPVVAALVEHPDGFVLVRGKGFPEGWYGLVTGFVERNEHPDAAVLREVAEELGVAGEIVAFIGHTMFEPRNQLVIAYHVQAYGPLCLGDELEAVKTVAPAELRPSSFSPSLGGDEWPMGVGGLVRDWLWRRESKR